MQHFLTLLSLEIILSHSLFLLIERGRNLLLALGFSNSGQLLARRSYCMHAARATRCGNDYLLLRWINLPHRCRILVGVISSFWIDFVAAAEVPRRRGSWVTRAVEVELLIPRQRHHRCALDMLIEALSSLEHVGVIAG